MIELKEFEQKMAGLGLTVEFDYDGDIKFKDDSKNYGFVLMDHCGIYDVKNLFDLDAISLVVEFAKTPLNKRISENKFKVHLFPGVAGYLNIYNDSHERVVIDNDVKDFRYITSFTKAEYNNVRDRVIKDGFYLPEYDESNTTIFEPVEG